MAGKKQKNYYSHNYVKHPTDTAAGNNGVAGQDRLQRTQKEDLTMQTVSLYRR